MNNTRILLHEGGSRAVQNFPDNQWQRLSSQWVLNEGVNAVHSDNSSSRKARWDQRFQEVSSSAYFDYAGGPSLGDVFVNPMDGVQTTYIGANDDAGFVTRFTSVFGGSWSTSRISHNDGQIVEYYYDGTDVEFINLAGGFARVPNQSGVNLLGITVSTPPATSTRTSISMTPEPLGGSYFAAEAELDSLGWGNFSIDNSTYAGDWLITSDQPGQYFLRTSTMLHGFYPDKNSVNPGTQPHYNLAMLPELGDEIYRENFFAVSGRYTVAMQLSSITGNGMLSVYFGAYQVGTFDLGGSPADQVVNFTGDATAGAPLRIVVSHTAGVSLSLLAVSTAASSNWLETFDSEPFQITYQISDVRNPSERRGDATRTVLLPGSKQNNRVLRHLFHSSRAWDLNRKVPASVITNGIVVMEGHMQITRVLESPDGVLRYEVVIFGTAVNLFDRVKDKKLSDLDVSDLDHDRNPANIVASWTAGHTNGYVYPLIDYGQDFDYADISTSGGEVKKEQLYPAVYARTLVDRIFREAGYTYSSDFLTSPDFASLVLPPTSLDGSRRLTVTASVLSQRQSGSDFYWIRIWKESPLGFSTQLVTVVLDETPLVPAVVTTGPVSVEPGYKVYVAASTGSSGFDILPGSFVELVHSDGGQGSFRASLTGTQSVGPSTGNAAILFDDDATSPNYDQLGVYDTSTGKCTLMRAPFRTFLPDMTQTDFLVGLVRAFNLCVEPRRDNPLELVIEPRDYFDDDAGYYDRSVVVRDWSKRLDLSKETTYQLVPDLVAGTYVYRYDDDDDHYNKDYKERAGSVYGTREFSVDSDFVKDVSEVQLPFSATPLVTMTDTSGYATVPVSKIGTIDSSGVWQMPASIRPRLLYYKWKELPELSSWWFEGTEYTSYPYAGHVDDPFDPVRDLNFGEAGFYYYPHQGGVTLFRRFHSRQMAEVASIDSRLMTCVVKLSPLDVNSLQFNNRIFLVGQGWYRLNKIEFDPNSPLHKVELTRAVDIRLQPGMTVIK